MDWFFIILIIGILIISFCIGYMFGLSKNKELDKKYFKEYERDMDLLQRLQKGEKTLESDFYPFPKSDEE